MFVNMFIWFACEFPSISRSISSFLCFSLYLHHVFFFPMGGHFCHTSRLPVFLLNFSDLHDVFYMDLAWTCLYDPNLSFIIRWPVFFGTILQNIENKCSVFRRMHACILFLIFFLCTFFLYPNPLHIATRQIIDQIRRNNDHIQLRVEGNFSVWWRFYLFIFTSNEIR